MIISGLEIKNMLNKEIFIEPFDDSRLNPNSYNLDYITNCWYTIRMYWT